MLIVQFVKLKRFENDFNIQDKMFNQFIQDKTDSGLVDRWYFIDRLNGFSSSFEKDYCLMWNDFVSFRIDLFSNKLESLLYSKWNCSKKDIKYFYSHFKYYRNHFAQLPTQGTQDYYLPKKERLDLYQEIVNYFGNSNSSIGISKMNNINPILVYYYIWNCIYFIMHKGYYDEADEEWKYGFDCLIGNNIFLYDSNQICQLLKEYIIYQLTQTNVFENRNKLLEYLFNNDFLEFNKLLEYSISDLVKMKTSGHISDYKKSISKDNRYDTGLSNIISNRLCYVIFHDLSMDSLNLSNEMMFPKLIKFYKFIFNFSIYLHCYPFEKHPVEQEYYLLQYFNCKDSVYENIAPLKQFNYLDRRYADDGTLLHGATGGGFRQMCQVLIKDGFDCKKINNNEDKTTPYAIAQERNDLFMIALFKREVLCLFFVNPCTVFCLLLFWILFSSVL